MERLRLDKAAQQAVHDYLEYRRIVGDDDGGTPFTPEEYEAYKRRVIPQRARNRLYVSYGVPGGMDCKLVGPETECFCAHRYKEHRTDFQAVPAQRPLALPCRVAGCRCAAYEYLPLAAGSRSGARCGCKHAARDHGEGAGHPCSKCPPVGTAASSSSSSCAGFRSPLTCGCGRPAHAHRTLVETRREREARGLPVGRDVPYAAMGGLTGFSSLADGYLRLDASGAGPPPDSLLHPEPPFQPHTFQEAYGGGTAVSSGRLEDDAAPDLRTQEERDMAYFERRYQERLKAERMQRVSASRTSSRPPRTLPYGKPRDTQ